GRVDDARPLLEGQDAAVHARPHPEARGRTAAGGQVVFGSEPIPRLCRSMQVQGSRFTRREVLATAGAAGVGFSRPLFGGIEPVTPEEYPKNAEAALERLKAGNVRFVEGNTRHAHEGADWRKQLVGTQKPFATILGCSDSRAPVELVFDQGFGDLFVVRVAVNVIGGDVV